MAIALVGHTKITAAGGGSVSVPVTSPAINTTGANFIILFYTFYNGGDYPAISDSKGNVYYPFSRSNAFSPALASEMRFTKQVIVGAGHTWTVQQSGTYPFPVFAFSLYIAAFSGVIAGADSNPNFFSLPWYNDGGNNVTAAASLSCNPGSAGGANGQLVVMGFGNTDPTNSTVVTAADGLGGTPSFTITDSDKSNMPLPSIINYNAGLAYYIQPTATGVTVTETWADWVDVFPHDGPLGQAVLSSGVFEPAAAPPPPTPGEGNRSCGGEMGPIRVAAAQTAPSITSNGGGASATVHVAGGATAVTTVVASGTANIDYGITGGANSSLFSMVAATGVLTFKAPAVNGTYHVNVEALNRFGVVNQNLTVVVP